MNTEKTTETKQMTIISKEVELKTILSKKKL